MFNLRELDFDVAYQSILKVGAYNNISQCYFALNSVGRLFKIVISIVEIDFRPGNYLLPTSFE